MQAIKKKPPFGRSAQRVKKQLLIKGSEIKEIALDTLVDIKKEETKAKDPNYERALPLYVAEKDGKELFVIPVRGKGLWIGMELNKSKINAKDLCLMLLNEGLLCKETHKSVIRFAPPLMISKDQLDWAINKIIRVISSI